MKIAVVGPSEERDALYRMLAEGTVLQGVGAEVRRFDTLPELMAAEEMWRLVLLYTDDAYYELACEFRRRQEECVLLLWSENDRWSRQSFALHPQGYLICPVQQETLREELYRCRDSLLPYLPYMVCSGAYKGRRLRFVEVRYMESFGHTCVLHCGEEEISFNRSLRSLEEEAGAMFVRCQRSFLVNLYWIDALRTDAVLLHSGEEIPVGAGQYREVYDAWAAFCEKCRPYQLNMEKTGTDRSGEGEGNV